MHRPLVALVSACWWFARYRVRAYERLRVAAARLPTSYPLWLSVYQSGPVKLDTLPVGRPWPSFAVHLHLASGQNSGLPEAAICSVLNQSYLRWELYITSSEGGDIPTPTDPRIQFLSEPFVSRARAMAYVLEITDAPYVVPLAFNFTLTPGALGAYAQAIAVWPPSSKPVLFYADQDEHDLRGRRCNPWLKPAWDEDLFLAQDYVSAVCAIPTATARRAAIDRDGPDAIAVYALVAELALGLEGLPVEHVPFIAVTTPGDAWRGASAARCELVAAIVKERAATRVSAGPFGTLVLQRPLLDPPPLVSVIVPTRDRVDLLATCVDGVLNHTDYPHIELIIADNGSVDSETLDYFQQCARDPRVKIARWPYPYNFSAINNHAAAMATGPYLCLLNNDTEVIDPTWLRELMAHAVRPEVGAVGARLLYPDRTIQHAGVVIGLGNAAGHAHRGLAEGQPGYFAQALVTRGATAVTAACLVVAKDKFNAVGGLDETELAIAYNDIDLCLKLRKAGWRNIYAPQAVMIHHESKSRGLDFAPEHLARYTRELGVFQERWGTKGFRDPMHHPALDPAHEEYRLKF